MPIALRSLANERGSDRDFVYLLILARKYGLEPTVLHRALVSAKGDKESKCGPLSIGLRGRGDRSSCFIFSRKGRAVAQTTISEDSLTKLRKVPPELMQLLNAQDRCSMANDRAELRRRIADLQIGLKHVNIEAKVIDKSEVRAVESRDGLPLAVCSATLSDGTGQIRLPLWNNQINSVAKNDTVAIREATVRYFRGEMQLSLPRKTGSISIVHSPGPIA